MRRLAPKDDKSVSGGLWQSGAMALLVVAMSGFLCPSHSWAQSQLGAVRSEFSAADQNQDGRVDEAELAADTAAAFSALDRNQDEKLTFDELPGATREAFDRIDANRDGVLTFDEVRRAKLRQFQTIDTDKDGAVTLDELTKSQGAGQ